MAEGSFMKVHREVRATRDLADSRAAKPSFVAPGTKFLGSIDKGPGQVWEMALGDDDRVARTEQLDLSGASFHIADVRIQESMSYLHAKSRHVLYATLHGASQSSAGQIGRGPTINQPDRAGAISFTPSDWERRGEIGVGLLKCAHIEIDPDFIADMVGLQIRHLRWSAPFNVSEPKLLAIITALAVERCAASSSPFLEETLLRAIARRTAQVFGAVTVKPDDGWIAPKALKRVVERIEAAVHEPLSLAALAAEAGLGISAFVRAFRGTTGQTPAAFAIDRRLDRAEQLAKTTGFPLRCIASATGFGSASHLISTFKKRRGVTLGRIRSR